MPVSSSLTKSRQKLMDLGQLAKMAKTGVDRNTYKMAVNALPSEDVELFHATWRKKLQLNLGNSVLSEIGEVIALDTEAAGVEKSKVVNSLSLDNALATRLAYIMAIAEEVFGTQKAAHAFLHRQHPLLHSTPFEKLETEWGGREVERLLNNVRFGMPA